MENIELLLNSSSLSMLLLEGLKWIIKKVALLGFKHEIVDFPPVFYVLAVPILNALMPFALIALGLVSTDPILLMGWADVVRYLVQIVLASLVSFLGYNVGVKPLKEYARRFNTLP